MKKLLILLITATLLLTACSEEKYSSTPQTTTVQTTATTTTATTTQPEPPAVDDIITLSARPAKDVQPYSVVPVTAVPSVLTECLNEQAVSAAVEFCQNSEITVKVVMEKYSGCVILITTDAEYIIAYFDGKQIHLLSQTERLPTLITIICNGNVFLHLGTDTDTIYSFEGNTPQKVVYSDRPVSITYHGLYLMCGYKDSDIRYPISFDNGNFGTVMQTQIEIADFTKRIENGGALLRAIEKQGYKATKIITAGWVSFWLDCGEKCLYFDFSQGNAEITEAIPRHDMTTADTPEYTDTITYWTDFPTLEQGVVLTAVSGERPENVVPLTAEPLPFLSDAELPTELRNKLVEIWLEEIQTEHLINEITADDLIESTAYLIERDFDNDGETEQIISLYSERLGWMYYCTGVFYVDGDNIITLSSLCNGTAVTLLKSDEHRFISVNMTFGVQGYRTEVYRAENNGLTPEIPRETLTESIGITEYNGYLLCAPKAAWAYYPVALCKDGQLRNIAVSSISAEDFCAHVHGGDELLNRCSQLNTPVTEILTAGYYSYWLKNGENTLYIRLAEEPYIITSLKFCDWFYDYSFCKESLYNVNINP